MNENINLCEILKDCPKGTKLYTPIIGEVMFQRIEELAPYQIIVCPPDDLDDLYYFTKEGKYYKTKVGECLLFPSKDQPDWSKWECPKLKKPKFDPKTLQPFDKVLARIDDGDAYYWFADFVSTTAIEKYDILPYIISNKNVKMIIPYNEETKHLVGTSDEAPECYRYWEE